MRWLALPALATALAGCATDPQRSEQPVIAITIDDLPVHNTAPAGETSLSLAQTMIAALRREGVTAYGFVNGAWTERNPQTLEILKAWRAAGLPLANHGWSHRHFNELTPAEFEQELAQNEPLLKQLSGSEDWRWFRYPFLDEGETAQKRAVGREILARRGYGIADVTMDFSDWQWTDPYVRCTRLGDKDAIARLERSYLRAAKESIAFSRTLAKRIYGRDIPYVLLLHVSGMTSHMTPRLLHHYRSEGFRIVSLDEAQRDPVYGDDMQPSLAAAPQGLEGQAAARNIPLPPRTNFAPLLEATCRS